MIESALTAIVDSLSWFVARADPPHARPGTSSRRPGCPRTRERPGCRHRLARPWSEPTPGPSREAFGPWSVHRAHPAVRADLPRPRLSTTSLIVPPSTFLTSRSRSNGVSAIANRRLGPISASNGSGGRRAHADHVANTRRGLADDIGEGALGASHRLTDRFERVQHHVLHGVANQLLAAREGARAPTASSAGCRCRRRVTGRTGPTRSACPRCRRPARDASSAARPSAGARGLRTRRAPTAAWPGRGDVTARVPPLVPAGSRPPGDGIADAPQVEIEVEMIVVDPQRPRRDHPARGAPAVAGGARGAVAPRTTRCTSSYVSGPSGARVEHGDARDVHVHRGTLQVQEAGVEAGEAFGRHVIERTATACRRRGGARVRRDATPSATSPSRSRGAGGSDRVVAGRPRRGLRRRRPARSTTSFGPAIVRIEPGQSIEWTKTGAARTRWTADDGSFDSGNLVPGAEFIEDVRRAGRLPVLLPLPRRSPGWG